MADITRGEDGRPDTGAAVRAAGLRSAAVAALAAAAVGVAACGGDGSEEAAEPTAVQVEAAVARLDTLAVNVEAVGTLEARARVEVRPETSGRVTSILFEEGAEVREGEVLVRQDQNELRADVQAARAAVSSAEAEVGNLERQVERNESLLEEGAISEQAYDDLETRLATARARLEEARAALSQRREALENATIRAPFDGRIGARQIDQGQFVSVGDPLFVIVDDDPLEIEFSVPERYLGHLHRGSPVEVTVQNMPDRRFRGRVNFVSPYVEPSTRTVTLKARIPNPVLELRAGQFANVLLQLQERPAVVVPEAAVLPRQEGSSVFVVAGGRAERREVETGLRREGLVELRSAVAAGDTVVVAGHQRLSGGTPVSVTPAPPDTASGEPPEAGARPADTAAGPPDTAAPPPDTASGGS